MRASLPYPISPRSRTSTFGGALLDALYNPCQHQPMYHSRALVSMMMMMMMMMMTA